MHKRASEFKYNLTAKASYNYKDNSNLKLIRKLTNSSASTGHWRYQTI